MQFIEDKEFAKPFQMVVVAAKSVWEWVNARMWPIYSSAVVLSVFALLASSSEKQIMADHYYGSSSSSLAKEREARLEEAKKYFHEEVTLAVKERVWQLPEATFQRKYSDRHASA